MTYRVRYLNPAKPGSGFIDGFRLARDAKQSVERFNALYDRNGHGIRAEYLGNSKNHQPKKPALPETTGVWCADRNQHGVLVGWREMFKTDDGRLVTIPESSRYFTVLLQGQ